MPLLRNQRTYPLSLKSAAQSTINAGIVSAYDYQGDPNNAYANGEGVAHVGTFNYAKSVATTFPLVQVTTEIVGRDPSFARATTDNYRGASFGLLGVGSTDGKSNFTIHRRFRAPTVWATNTVRALFVLGDAGGAKITLYTQESSNGYIGMNWDVKNGTVLTQTPSNAARLSAANQVPFNAIFDIYLVREGNTVKAFLNGVLVGSQTLLDLVTYDTAWAGTAFKNGIAATPATDYIFIDETNWSRALSDAEVAQHQADPYAGYTSNVVAPTATITNQPSPDGQSQRFVGTTTNATSGNYTLTGSNGGVTVGPLSFAISANAFDFTHTGLTAGSYSPTLTVTGSGGPGGVSGTSAFSIAGVGGGGEVFPPDIQAPVMSGAITLSQIRESSFTATWPAATDNIGVVGYEYSFGSTYTALGNVTTYAFTAQPVGSNRTLSIRATDATGLRSNALTVAVSTLPAQIPATPTGVSASIVTGQTVAVVFTPDPAVIDNPTTLYTVSASNGQTATGTASPIQIVMPAGFAGTFTVTATNSIGTSAASVPSNEIIIGGALGDVSDPAMVGGVTIDILTDTIIGFSWQPATDNVGVTDYQYSFDGGATFTSNGTARNVVRGDLSPSTGYSVMVRARDQAGNTSEPLALVISTLEAPAPSLPAAVPSPTLASRSYEWLKDAVARWTHRSDLGSMLDDFVMLAEKRINGDIEARLQVAVTTIRTTPKLGGALLPSDVADIKALSLPLAGPLEYLPADTFNAHVARGEFGKPKFYTVFGPYLYLAPVPDAVYDIACAYRQKIPSLLDEADGVNWLIRDQPDIYLAAVMCEALNYTENVAKLPVWEAKYRDAVDSLNGLDWSRATSLRIRSDAPTV